MKSVILNLGSLAKILEDNENIINLEVIIKLSKETQKEETPVIPQSVTEETATSKKDEPVLHEIKSPMVGTFYAASKPGAEPFVKVGDTVSEKTVVCIIEAMKQMNEIEADISGKIVEIKVGNGQGVGHGEVLFLVE